MRTLHDTRGGVGYRLVHRTTRSDDADRKKGKNRSHHAPLFTLLPHASRRPLDRRTLIRNTSPDLSSPVFTTFSSPPGPTIRMSCAPAGSQNLATASSDGAEYHPRRSAISVALVRILAKIPPSRPPLRLAPSCTALFAAARTTARVAIPGICSLRALAASFPTLTIGSVRTDCSPELIISADCAAPRSS